VSPQVLNPTPPTSSLPLPLVGILYDIVFSSKAVGVRLPFPHHIPGIYMLALFTLGFDACRTAQVEIAVSFSPLFPD